MPRCKSKRRIKIRLLLGINLVEKPRRYYNTKQQVGKLEALLRQLPAPSTPARPGRRRSVPGTARQLEPGQVEDLIAGYLAGQTVYQLGEQFGVDHGF